MWSELDQWNCMINVWSKQKVPTVHWSGCPVSIDLEYEAFIDSLWCSIDGSGCVGDLYQQEKLFKIFALHSHFLKLSRMQNWSLYKADSGPRAVCLTRFKRLQVAFRITCITTLPSKNNWSISVNNSFKNNNNKELFEDWSNVCGCGRQK